MGIVWALTWGSNTGVEGANRAVALGLIGRVLSLYVLLAVGSWFALGFALWRDGSANVGAPVPTSTQPTTPARPSGPTQPAAAAQRTALTAPAADDQPFEARLAQAYLEGYRAAQHQGTGTPFRAHPSPAVADLAALGGRLASALAAPGSAAAVVASLAALASGATLIAAYVFHLGLPRQDAIIFAMFCGTVALFAAAPSLAPRAGRTGALALRAAQVGMLVDTLAAAYLAQRQFYDPRLPEAWIPIAISMLGACLLGSGLLIVGLFTLRRGLLTRWQFAPLLLGLATLAGIANTAPLLSAQLLSTPGPRFAADQMSSSFPLVTVFLTVAGWLALGVALWPAAASVQPVSARGSPSVQP